MNQNVKVVLGSIYLISLGILLYTLFSFFEISEIGNFSYIKDNSQLLINYKNENLELFIFLFFIFSIIWIFLLGFASPLIILTGCIFGKFLGSFIALASITIGCTILYCFANFYLKNLFKNYLDRKISSFKHLFKKNEFLYYFLFRLTGGLGIPFAIQNILPIVFEMKIKNYFYSTLIGLIPTIFIFSSIGSGLKNLISKKEDVSFLTIILDRDIYLPLGFFVIILIVSYFIKKKYFQK